MASVIAVCISEKKGTIKSGDAICVDTVAGKGADLILFPEIQFCPFFPQYEKLDVSKYTMSIYHS